MVPHSDIPADALLAMALLLLAAAALCDIAARRIPNRIAALVALAGLLRQACLGGAFGSVLAAAALVLLGGVLLWLRGALGGGDVKLLAATALLVPASGVPGLLLAVALAGGVLALLHCGLRRLLPAPSPGPRRGLARVLRREAQRIRRGAPLPYGVAIACGAGFVLIGPGA